MISNFNRQTCQRELKRRREKELQLESDLAAASKEILRLRAMLKECSTSIPLDNNNQQTSTVWSLRARPVLALSVIMSCSHKMLNNIFIFCGRIQLL